VATIPRMIPTQRLPASLTPLDVALTALLDRLEPVAPIELPLVQALGCVAADMPSLKAIPPHDIAAADGWAFHAESLGEEFFLLRFGVDEHHVGVAAPRGVERLAGALRDHLDVDIGLGLEQRQQIAE